MKVYVKTSKSEPPLDTHYYIVAKNGLFLCKKNPVMETILPVDKIPFLDIQQQELNLKYHSLTKRQTLQILSFFFQAYKKFHGESIVLLHHSSKNGYLLHPPHQKVCRETIDYSPQDRFNGYLLVGSIHSHGKSMAFHSDGHEFSDYDDEVNFDGLHITVGNINSKVFTISCSVMVNGKRFFLNPLKYMRGIKEVKIVKPKPILSEDDNQVEKPLGPVKASEPVTYPKTTFLDSSYPSSGLYWAPLSGNRHWYKLMEPGSQMWNKLRDSKLGKTLFGTPKETKEEKKYLGHPFKPKIPFFFSLDLSKNKTINDVKVPDEWMKQLKRYPLVERVKLNLTCFV